MKQTKILNNNCENYVQHYYYNKNLKSFFTTNSGHCKKFKKNCDCCSDFVVQAKSSEETEISIHQQLSRILNILNFIIKLFDKE